MSAGQKAPHLINVLRAASRTSCYPEQTWPSWGTIGESKQKKNPKNTLPSFVEKPEKSGLYHGFPFPLLTPKPSLFLNSVVLHAS